MTLIDRDHLGRIVVAGGLSCPVVAPRAQVEIKRMMPVWNPALPGGRRTGRTSL
ncbi:hypothetical protein ACPCDX_00555 [Streptomyces koyangensis]|uniref:hypothetical protein n=1 Tax=Streptomyces koyangensis TaxID=188770 RepID=UPI003C2F5209